MSATWQLVEAADAARPWMFGSAASLGALVMVRRMIRTWVRLVVAVIVALAVGFGVVEAVRWGAPLIERERTCVCGINLYDYR